MFSKKWTTLALTFALAAASVGAGETMALQEPPLKSEKERISYSIGMQIGMGLKRDGLEIDPQALATAVGDVLAGKETALSMEEAQQVLMGLREKMQQKQQEEQAAAGAENANSGKAFLTKNATREEVAVTESGLQYMVIEPGKGETPELDDTVKVHYTGKLLDGSVFDSSVERGEPAVFPVTGVIAGWTEALQLMPVGAKYRLFIPANLAYGERGAGGGRIAPNSTLIFDVELLGIEEGEQGGGAGQ